MPRTLTYDVSGNLSGGDARPFGEWTDGGGKVHPGGTSYTLFVTPDAADGGLVPPVEVKCDEATFMQAQQVGLGSRCDFACEVRSSDRSSELRLTVKVVRRLGQVSARNGAKAGAAA